MFGCESNGESIAFMIGMARLRPGAFAMGVRGYIDPGSKIATAALIPQQ